MSKGDFLGEFEQLVLLAVVRLGEDAYGMSVRRELEASSGRSVTIGAVYATLDRLETKGLLRSRRAQPERRPGGRSRRLFDAEPAGRAALLESRRLLDRMWRGVDLADERHG